MFSGNQRTPGGALGTVRFQELYPGLKAKGVDSTSPTSTAAASGGARLGALGAGPTAPATVLVAVIVLLVTVRVLYEMAGEKLD